MPERITITEREPDPGQQWKCGDEFLPFHPQASHVPPEYRDGWNRCYWMAIGRAMPDVDRIRAEIRRGGRISNGVLPTGEQLRNP